MKLYNNQPIYLKIKLYMAKKWTLQAYNVLCTCHFSLVCDGGMYGDNCNVPCGSCYESKQCHHINGMCLNGCTRGYQGLLCTTGEFSPNDKWLLSFCVKTL